MVVPLDGFHLADVELVRRGLRDRKGAPETFDADGYAALLARIRSRPDRTVMAPLFERGLEQPLAGGIAVRPRSTWSSPRATTCCSRRRPGRQPGRSWTRSGTSRPPTRSGCRRLVARHERFGKSPDAAREWVERVDGANAVRIEAAAHRADLILDLTAWEPPD